MNQDERNAAILAKYIPDKAIPVIVKWIKEFDFKLKLTKVRNSKLGDYRPPIDRPNHQITINHNLNPYAFLVTLVHEIAHLTCYNKFKNNVSPHGSEWKREYCHLMTFFMNDDIFPNDVLFALATHLRTPGASSCSDADLLRALKRYDVNNAGSQLVFLEKLPFRTRFLFNGDRVFEKGLRLRTRYRCTEISSGAVYLFHALAEVELFEPISGVQSSFHIDGGL